MARLYLFGGVLALLAAAFFWIRSDAQSDLIQTQEAEAAKARITHIEDARQTDDEIRQTDDDALCNELYRRLSGGGCPDGSGGAVQ